MIEKCNQINVTIGKQSQVDVSFPKQTGIDLVIEKSAGGGSYPPLSEKPSINNVVLLGNKTFEELGVQTMTNLEIKEVFDKVFNKEGGN